MTSPKLPEFSDFLTAAMQHPLVALCVPLAFDHETAITLADRYADEPYFFLLESATVGPNARYSFLGFDPIWTWHIDSCLNKTCEYSLRLDGGATQSQSLHLTDPNTDPINALRDIMSRWHVATVYPKGTRLGGPDTAAMVGATGFFGFDIGQALEPMIGKAPPKTLGVPDAAFFLPRQFLIVDHLARRLFVVRNVPINLAITERSEAKLRRQFESELELLVRQVETLSTVHQ